MKDNRERTLLERVLGLFTEVRSGEGGTALLLTLNVFLLLTAYYVIKPVREGLILSRASGADIKSGLSAAIAVVLLFAVPLYARVANRLPRNRLIIGVTLFFVSHLILFYVSSTFEVVRPHLAIVFFVWVGIFNMMVVAQFWAFANDIYTDEQGKRLFALIGLGATIGGAVGSKIASAIVEFVGVYQMLLVAGGLLLLCAFLTQLAHRRESHQTQRDVSPATSPSLPPAAEREKKPLVPSGAFELVFKNKYLLAVAFFSLVFSLVNTNGEYMLGKLASAESAKLVAAGELTKEQAGAWITKFYADFSFMMNVVCVLMQAFLVSRIIRYGGLKFAFFVFPVIALLDSTAVAIVPALAVIRIGKMAENAADYSLNNTLRNMLWLPTTRDMKYKAKQAVDTFFVRMGDVTSFGLVMLARTLEWQIRVFAIANVLLVIVWIGIAIVIVREHVRLTQEKERAPLGAEAQPA